MIFYISKFLGKVDKICFSLIDKIHFKILRKYCDYNLKILLLKYADYDRIYYYNMFDGMSAGEVIFYDKDNGNKILSSTTRCTGKKYNYENIYDYNYVNMNIYFTKGYVVYLKDSSHIKTDIIAKYGVRIKSIKKENDICSEHLDENYRLYEIFKKRLDNINIYDINYRKNVKTIDVLKGDLV